MNGEYAYSLTPIVLFDQELFLQFSIEAYSWNPIPEDGGKVTNANLEERLIHIDYIRTFVLVNKTN